MILFYILVSSFMYSSPSCACKYPATRLYSLLSSYLLYYSIFVLFCFLLSPFISSSPSCVWVSILVQVSFSVYLFSFALLSPYLPRNAPSYGLSTFPTLIVSSVHVSYVYLAPVKPSSAFFFLSSLNFLFFLKLLTIRSISDFLWCVLSLLVWTFHNAFTIPLIRLLKSPLFSHSSWRFRPSFNTHIR